MIPAFMLPMLIGGGLGAMKSKDPLKGALLGAGLGAAGAAAGPALGGLLGSAGTAGTAAAYGTGLGTQQTAMLAAQEAGMGGIGLKDALGYAAPIGQAMGVAQQFMPEDQAAPPPPQLAQQTGGGILAQLAQMPQAQMPGEQERMMRRQQRRGLV
jgi:hypothetical protein